MPAFENAFTLQQSRVTGRADIPSLIDAFDELIPDDIRTRERNIPGRNYRGRARP